MFPFSHLKSLSQVPISCLLSLKSPVSVSYVSFLTSHVPISHLLSPVSRLLCHVNSNMSHASCLTFSVCFKFPVLHLMCGISCLMFIVCVTSPISLMSVSCLLSVSRLLSVSCFLSHVLYMSHVSCLSHVSFLSHVYCLFHISCLLLGGVGLACGCRLLISKMQKKITDLTVGNLAVLALLPDLAD